MTKVIIKKNDKFLSQEQFFNLLNDFINDSCSGNRLKKNGERIRETTTRNYFYMSKILLKFSIETTFEIKLILTNKIIQTEREKAQRYWKKFYNEFTSFLYDKMNYYDNYVGLIIKSLKSFFNYLENEKCLPIGNFHKSFYVPKEDIQIVALNHHQLNYIIFDENFNEVVKQQKLERIKDVFVFGCTVALRVSDLMTLSKNNLMIQNEKYYINVRSLKTNTNTSIKLPDYCVEILKKYTFNSNKLLPKFGKVWFNEKLKEFAALLPDDFEMVKTRTKRGKQVVVYKNVETRTHFKLSDHICTHTMRRTAITNMLRLGMPEHMVRKISGHSANSKEFFRYVKFVQSYIDEETDKFFEKLSSVNLINA